MIEHLAKQMNVPNGGSMDEPRFNVNVTPGAGINLGVQAEIDILKE